ncbi:nucleotidyltransferase domain-containing protein [Elizabethkingia meningoseptica]|nr:nucleotidyltransferase domain-containing protein [Elizabethkingia meningoseptica]
MTGWDGWPLGGQEGLDQSVNGITFLGGLMTGGISSEAKATKDVLSTSEILRIKNAASKINKPISVVGSRANGTAKAYSDWDYVIENLNSKEWSKIKNSIPGAKSTIDNTPRNIDIFKGKVDKTKPYITINPR